jgi:hypothetical protein
MRLWSQRQNSAKATRKTGKTGRQSPVECIKMYMGGSSTVAVGKCPSDSAFFLALYAKYDRVGASGWRIHTHRACKLPGLAFHVDWLALGIEDSEFKLAVFVGGTEPESILIALEELVANGQLLTGLHLAIPVILTNSVALLHERRSRLHGIIMCLVHEGIGTGQGHKEGAEYCALKLELVHLRKRETGGPDDYRDFLT